MNIVHILRRKQVRSLNAMTRGDMICESRRISLEELTLANVAGTRKNRADHVRRAAGWTENAETLSRIDPQAGRTKEPLVLRLEQRLPAPWHQRTTDTDR